MPVASRACEAAHVVDGELVATTAVRPVVVLDYEAFGPVAECTLEILLAGKFYDQPPHVAVEAHPASRRLLEEAGGKLEPKAVAHWGLAEADVRVSMSDTILSKPRWLRPCRRAQGACS